MTVKRMAIFRPGDVVKVPFPYTDRPIRQHRPALVIASPDLKPDAGLLWVLMITSAEHRSWTYDVPISDLGRAGLPADSVIRCAKIATIESQDAEHIGSVTPIVRETVSQQVRRILSSRE